VGTVRLDPEGAFRMAGHARDMGGRVAIHAIGDRANAITLDVMERLVADATDPALLRIEHASVLGPDEIRRFADSGVTASVQPAFLASETGWLEKRVGDRIRTTYPFRTLLEAGVPLAGGSDCPVEPPHPLWGMAVARDRAGIVPAEGLGAEDALALFTDWAAEAMGEPPPLTEGSPADLVVLDRDPVDASPDGLRDATVIATYVDGDVVDIPPDGVVWRD
jgi:predicted amidohydrolase YtcJ